MHSNSSPKGGSEDGVIRVPFEWFFFLPKIRKNTSGEHNHKTWIYLATMLGKTVDASEIRFPTTWDGAKTL